MNKKRFLILILVLVAALVFATAALAQDGDDDEFVDLVRLEIRNQDDNGVFIILSTFGLPEEDEDGGFTTDIFEGRRLTPQIRRLLQQVGTESGRDRFYGLSVAAGSTRTFTVERGVYYHRTVACGDQEDGVVDVSSQLRLVFIPCDGKLPNAGEPTMEKVDFPEDPGRVYWRYRIQ